MGLSRWRRGRNGKDRRDSLPAVCTCLPPRAITVDGTRLKAVNSGQRNFTKSELAKAMTESDERLAR